MFSEKYGIYINSNGEGRTTWQYRYLNYDVMDTDYDNYAVVYSCDEWLFGLYHTENVWLLSRKPELDHDYYVKAVDLIDTQIGDTYNSESNLKSFGLDCGYKVGSP